jgi:hypothetical protein
MSRMLSLACVAIVALAPVHASAQPAPKSLADVGEFGENIYDEAKANEWAKAVAKHQDLQKAAQQLAGEMKSADLRGLDMAVAAIGRAVTAKDRMTAMKQANQVTLIAADLNEPFRPQIPSAVTRLDVYGRELEMGVEAKDQTQLKTAVAALRKNWDSVKAAVRAKGGNAEAQRFDVLMAQAEAAKTPEDYAKVAKPMLDEVDNLEKVFSK